MGSVIEAHSSSGEPPDTFVSLGWHELELRCDMILWYCELP